MRSTNSDQKNSDSFSVMDMLLRNLNELKHEFVVAELSTNLPQSLQLANTTTSSEIIQANQDDDKIIKAPKNRSKTVYRSLAGIPELNEDLSPSSDNESDCDEAHESGNQGTKSKNLFKSFEEHVLSHDSGCSSSEDCDIISLSLLDNILKNASLLPLNPEEPIETENDSCYEEDERDALLEDSILEKGWQVVTSKPVRPDFNLQSVFCAQRAICSKGPRCKSKHTPKEREAFEARRAAKAANSTEFNDAKFRTELCKMKAHHQIKDTKRCRFAHGTEQLICRACYEVGHRKDKCHKAKKVSIPARS